MDTQVTQRYSKVDLFSPKGRMGQNAYFFYSTFLSLILLWATVHFLTGFFQINNALMITSSSISLSLAGIVSLSLLLFLTIQRCHDFDKNGWFAVFVAIPFASFFYASTLNSDGLNRYGEPPEPASKFIIIANYLIVISLVISIILFILRSLGMAY